MPFSSIRSLVPWFQRTFVEYSVETNAGPNEVVELAVLGNVNRVMWGDNTYGDLPVETGPDGTLTFTHRYETKGPRRNIRVHGDGITRMRVRSTDLGSLRVCLLDDAENVPVRASFDAAGYDLFAAFATVIPPRGRDVVQTGLSIAVPRGTYGRIAPRSGLAIRDGIAVGGGVIDPDYRGEVGVVLFNHGDRPFVVEPGDRIAQLILERAETPTVVVTDSLDETDRGARGFGSTGKKDV